MAYDYHFVYLDPALSSEWFFVAARRYWDKFRPIVAAKLDLIDHVPARRTLAITLLTRRDLAPQTLAQIKARFPNALLDPLVYDVPDDMQLTLDGRAALDQRFGVPE
jgi:hypothetical protein